MHYERSQSPKPLPIQIAQSETYKQQCSNIQSLLCASLCRSVLWVLFFLSSISFSARPSLVIGYSFVNSINLFLILRKSCFQYLSLNYRMTTNWNINKKNRPCKICHKLFSCLEHVLETSLQNRFNTRTTVTNSSLNCRIKQALTTITEFIPRLVSDNLVTKGMSHRLPTRLTKVNLSSRLLYTN